MSRDKTNKRENEVHSSKKEATKMTKSTIFIYLFVLLSVNNVYNDYKFKFRILSRFSPTTKKSADTVLTMTDINYRPTIFNKKI